MITDEERREVARRDQIMNDEKRNDVSNKLMDAAKCISKDDVACVLNDALHGEKKLSGINENCSTCCSVSLAELADLVKPSCDRDALLELAGELDRVGYNDWLYSGEWDPEEIARRIREAVNACEARPDAPAAVDDGKTDTDANEDEEGASAGYYEGYVHPVDDDDYAACCWVRENGGLEAVKARMIPEGMEWPRYEGDELVRFGDEVADSFGGKFEEPVVSIEFFEKGFTLYGGRSQRFYGYEERVERFSPKVLASDGEPLEVGQTVYATHYGYAKCTVLAIEWAVDGYLVEVENEGGHKFRQAPDEFTHKRPVLDADGALIKKGDAVWHVTSCREYVVIEPSYGETVVVRLAGHDDADGEQYAPGQLTHTKPDSWERIEEDAENVAKLFDGFDADASEDIRDIVRRAKALAERRAV